ncbi:MAG: tetratricopeptide repeat protein [Minwuia sp.]|nr:tetratricopeptide repeat protein [Minwuia sp.]
MSDDLIFREVDEDVRRDRATEMARRYGGYAIGAVVLIVATTVAIVGWREYTASRQQDQGAAFERAMVLLEGERPAEAAEIFERLVADGSDGYRALGGQQAAAARAAAGDEAGALSAYDRIRQDDALPQEQRDLAAIKAAMLALRLEDGDAAISRLQQVLNASGPFRNMALEVQAAAHLNDGDRQKAVEILTALTQDATASEGVKARAGQFLRALGVE